MIVYVYDLLDELTMFQHLPHGSSSHELDQICFVPDLLVDMHVEQIQLYVTQGFSFLIIQAAPTSDGICWNLGHEHASVVLDPSILAMYGSWHIAYQLQHLLPISEINVDVHQNPASLSTVLHHSASAT